MIVLKGSIALITVSLISVISCLFTTTSWRTIREERIEAGVCDKQQNKDWDLCLIPDNETDAAYSYAAYPALTYKNYHCSCDSNCVTYGDCCINSVHLDNSDDGDGDGDGEKKRKESIFGCNQVADTSFSIYTSSKCSRDWDVSIPFKANIANKCAAPETGPSTGHYLAHIPVYSNWTANIYANIFCAICNSDAGNLEKWSVELNCKPQNRPDSPPNSTLLLPLVKEQFADSRTYDSRAKAWKLSINGTEYKCTLKIKELVFPDLVTKYGARLCRDVVKDCSREWTDPSTREKCGAYTAFLVETNVMSGELRTFKNYHCALCNNINMSTLSCEQPVHEKRLNLYPGVGRGFGGYGHSRYPRPGLRTLKVETNQLWYPLVLDFKSGDGQLVGEICSLEKGQLYDPLQEKCIDLFCGKLFQWDNSIGQCVLTDLRSNGTLGLSKDCFKINIKEDGFSILPNGSVFVNQTSRIYWEAEYEVHVNDSDFIREILICAEDIFINFPNNQLKIQAIVSEIFLCVSIACLTLHLIAYTMVPKLRNLPGKILASFSVSLIGAHASFLMAGNAAPDATSSSCLVLSVAAHYFFLCSFFWMNVMAFDVSSTFHSLKSSDQQNDRRLFIKYFVYSWFGPLLIIGSSISLDIFWETNAFRPRYGYKICWINQKKALLMFFVLPLALILLANVAFFLATSYLLIKSKKEVKMARKSDKIRFILYLKLALIMGLTWIFGFMGALSSYQSLWFPFIFFNGLQGAFIFAAFTCKRRNWQQIAFKIKSTKKIMKPTNAVQSKSTTGQTSANTSTSTVNVIP